MSEHALVHRTRPALEGQPPYPGLVLFHGLGSNEEDLLGALAGVAPRLYLVSARAPEPYTWGGYTWYDLEEGYALQGEGITLALDRIRRFISQLPESYPIDPSRLLVGGFSMGAAMVGATALLEPKLVSGEIMLSGWLPPDNGDQYRLKEAAGLPFFQGHGALDPTVSITFARMTRDFLAQVPVDLTYREYPIGHEVSLQELRDLAMWLETVLGVPPDGRDV